MKFEESQFNKRSAHFNKLPEIIFIETVFGCNLNCEMCPVPKDIMSRKKTLMSFFTFTKIIDQISDKKRYLGLTQLGEPLLNKNISDFIRYAKKYGHFTHLTTNATLLDRDISADLLEAGLDSITFSVDGADKKTYEKIRIGATFEETVGNINFFCNLNKKTKRNCKTQVDCIVSDLTEKSKKDITIFWDDIVPVNFIPLDNWTNQIELPDYFGKKRVPNDMSMVRYPCRLLWTVLSISAEGKVMYCCHDYYHKSGLPSIHDKPLIDIWNNEIANEREKHAQDRVDTEPCKSCIAWQTMPKYYFSFPERLINAFIKKWYKQ